jgi:hypothetical protein
MAHLGEMPGPATAAPRVASWIQLIDERGRPTPGPRSTSMMSHETGQPTELLIAVSRRVPGSLSTQIANQLRRAIRSGALRPGARLPSTRDLAKQAGVSRGVVVNAYAQLRAEAWSG